MTSQRQDYELATAPGRSVHVTTRQAQSDTTLFFIHGGGGNKEQWREQIRHFSNQPFNSVAWDAFGHGRSPTSRREEDFHASAFIHDLATVFARHKTQKNIVIAHSFGCRLFLAWLLQEWSRHQTLPVDGAVLLGPAPHETRRKGLFGNWMDNLPLPAMELLRPMLGKRFEKLAWHESADPALLRHERLATRGNSLFMMRAMLENAPVFPASALRALPDFPLALLGGQHDGLVPATTLEAIQAARAGSTSTILADCAHQIMLEKPEDTNAAIERIIQQATARA
ncbi:alpha/beta fold hydrolase [Acetobacter vaccinii]|uniref:Alpha/beta hydrolase n=1 Tax=Acetobacter vaccinii TaxID=2592655 RepID=A0A5C1YLM5_9PROT|nr:alpha/beta fold hydrolase [Acetobacter vaccinii]QEO16811.1 alpha/beta hydrolase [Acetobacter vaccinii]